MKAEEQLQQLSNDIEGYINDYEGGIFTKEELIDGLIGYLLKRVTTSNNSKLQGCIDKMEVKREKWFHLGKKYGQQASEEAIEIIKSKISK